MISWKRTNQGGALRTFLIVAVLLAIATIVSINFVHNRGEQARRDQAIAQANDQAAADKAAPNPNEDTSKDGDKTDTSSEPSVSVASEDSTPVEQQTSNILPTTGTEDSIVSIFMIGLMAGVIVAHGTSRRALKRPL